MIDSSFVTTIMLAKWPMNQNESNQSSILATCNMRYILYSIFGVRTSVHDSLGSVVYTGCDVSVHTVHLQSTLFGLLLEARLASRGFWLS
mmetsp:Transcript_26722/g.58584  ORF Transcript_26722/g.58584 Transcript_26722/m.58584 type:complete len:90 (-) Transcript_26722:1906-2175(-)